MTNEIKYENYPLGIVILSGLVSLLIYGSGILIMLSVHPVAAVIFSMYILVLEFRLLKNHCVNCYYRGKTCGFGKGKISALLFKKGDVSLFYSCEMTWKNMIPDMLVSIIPLVTGIIILIMDFDLVILISIILLVLLTTSGNGFIRGNLTCRYCKQKDIGCPAEKLFSKDKGLK